MRCLGQKSSELFGRVRKKSGDYSSFFYIRKFEILEENLLHPRNMESISLLLKGWHKFCTILVKNLSKFAYVKKNCIFAAQKFI